MANPVPYKFYKYNGGGQTYVEMLPGTNTPYGYSEINYDEFKKYASRTGQLNPDGTPTDPSTVGKYGDNSMSWGSTSQYDKLLADPKYAAVLQAGEKGQTSSSGMVQAVDPISGQTNWMTQETADAFSKMTPAQIQEQKTLAGTMTQAAQTQAAATAKAGASIQPVGTPTMVNQQPAQTSNQSRSEQLIEQNAQRVAASGDTNLGSYSPAFQQRVADIRAGNTAPANTGTNTTSTQNGLLDPTGKMFQTGDPSTDKFLNETYLPLITDAMNGDPGALYNSEAFQKIKDTVEKTWGPVFQNELNAVKSKFDLQEQSTTASQTEAKRQADLVMQQSTQDTALAAGRLDEDRIRALAKNADTIQEAKQIGLDHARQSRLTFSGIAGKQQAKIQRQGDLQTQDINTTASRKLSDINLADTRLQADTAAKSQFQQGEFGRDLTNIGLQRTAGNQEVDAARMAQQQAERQRLIDLGGSLVKSNASIY